MQHISGQHIFIDQNQQD